MNSTLKILTWPEYINPETIFRFEMDFGVKVELQIVPSAVELIDRMKSDASVTDVLVPPDYAVRELAAESRLLELDHTLLPNLIHLDQRFLRGRAHDPDSRLSVTKDWGTTGFMYRTDLISESPGSWAEFWQLSKKYTGKVTVLDSPGEVIGAALKMRGRSYNSTSSESMAAAREDLLQLQPHLFAFETAYKTSVASGEVFLALGWNGDAAALAAQGVPVAYVIPSEGSQIWEDDWAISVNTSVPELAHAFINFVTMPEVAASEARFTRYATGNRDALMFLEVDIKHDPSTYPSPELLSKLEPGMPLDEEGQMLREILWREIRG